MKFISISTFVILLSSVTSPCYAEEPDFSKIFENIDFGAIEQMIENNPALKKMADNIDKAIEDDDDEALENAFKGIPPMAMPDEKATESLAEQKQQREEKEKEIAEREKRKLESRGHMLKITEDIIGPLNATVRLISPIRMGGELGDRLSKACHKLNKVQSIVEQMLDNEIYVDEFFAKKINEKFSAERITKLNRRLTAETGTTLDEDEATANEAEDKFIQRRKRTAPQSKPPKEKTISETIDLANELELVEEEIKEQVVENKELKTKLEAELKEHPKEKERYRDGGGYSAPYSSGYDRSDYGDRDDEYARDSSPYSSYGGNSSWRDYPNNYDYKYPKGKTGTTTSSNQGDGKKNQTFGGPLPQNERPLGGINEALDQFIGSAIVDKIIELGDEKFTYKTPEFFDTMTEAFSTIKFSELSQLVKTLDVKIKDRSEKDKPKKEPSKTKKKEETEKPEEKKIAEYKSKKLAMAPGLAKLTSYPVRFPAGKGKGDQTLHLPGMLYEAATARQLSKKVIEGHLKEVRHHIIALKDLCENLKKDTGFASKMTAAEKQIEKNADAYESEQSKQTLSTIELSNKNFKNPSALLKSLSALTDAGLKLRYEKPTIKSFQAHFQEKKSTGEKVHSLIRVTNNLIQGQKKSSQEIEQLKLAVKELEWAWTPELKGLAVKEATPGKGRQQPAQSQGGMPSPQEMAIFLRNMGMQDEQIQQALQDPQTIQQVVSLMHQQGQVGGPPHQQQRRPQSQPQQPQEPEKKWYQQIPIIGEFL